MGCEIPLTLGQALAQYLTAYWLIQYNGNFIYLVAVAVGNGLCAASSALLLGCLVKDAKFVTELSPLLFVPQLLFCGFFIRTSMVPVFLRWAQYLCSLKYALNLTLLIEFGDNNANCKESTAAMNNCENVLDNNDIEKDQAWIYVFLLLIIFVVFRTLACTALVAKSQKYY